tara:strand:+ start:370 stop:672 length:303 start_codon:yes stop_codon:yes gene_type:complete
MSFDKEKFKKSSNPFKPKDVIKGSLSGDPGNVFRTGRTSAKKAQERQSLLIEKQRQVSEKSLSEATDETARRKALSKSKTAGRGSLIAPSAKSNNLGGTV